MTLESGARFWRSGTVSPVRQHCVTSAPRTIIGVASSVGQQYLLLADISGYTSFVVGVEEAHGVDFSDGIPPGYELLGALLDAVMEGVKPEFSIAKLEGDAVFATAPTESLDGCGN